jgi:hypothetical protein
VSLSYEIALIEFLDNQTIVEVLTFVEEDGTRVVKKECYNYLCGNYISKQNRSLVADLSIYEQMNDFRL